MIIKKCLSVRFNCYETAAKRAKTASQGAEIASYRYFNTLSDCKNTIK